MFMWGGNRDDEDRNPLAGLLVMILGPIAAALIQAAISRSREYNADTEGALISGDPMYLASALEKLSAYSKQIPMDANPAYSSMFIVEPTNVMQKLANLWAPHPPVEKTAVST